MKRLSGNFYDGKQIEQWVCLKCVPTILVNVFGLIFDLLGYEMPSEEWWLFKNLFACYFRYISNNFLKTLREIWDDICLKFLNFDCFRISKIIWVFLLAFEIYYVNKYFKGNRNVCHLILNIKNKNR